MAGATQQASEMSASERRKQSDTFTEEISVLEGANYQSEIHCRPPSVACPQYKEMHDSILMCLRNIICELDTGVPELLDRFTADANAILDFLAYFGLNEVDLRYWEALCREVEFPIRQCSKERIISPKFAPHAVLEGANYQSEIHCRRPSVARPQYKEMHDCVLMCLRNIIRELDPGEVELLDCFTADANAILDFLAHFGLNEVDLRYWEAFCREVESPVRQMRSLSIVRNKTSLSDLRERVRIRQEAAALARAEFEKSAEALRAHRHQSACIAIEIENLNSEIRNFWKIIPSLEVERDRITRAIERDQHSYQIYRQAKLDIDVALTALKDLLVEAEHDSLCTIMSHL